MAFQGQLQVSLFPRAEAGETLTITILKRVLDSLGSAVLLF